MARSQIPADPSFKVFRPAPLVLVHGSTDKAEREMAERLERQKDVQRRIMRLRQTHEGTDKFHDAKSPFIQKEDWENALACATSVLTSLRLEHTQADFPEKVGYGKPRAGNC